MILDKLGELELLNAHLNQMSFDSCTLITTEQYKEKQHSDLS